MLFVKQKGVDADQLLALGTISEPGGASNHAYTVLLHPPASQTTREKARQCRERIDIERLVSL